VIRAVLATVLVIALVPRRHEVIRIGAALNLAVIIVAWTVSSPVGSNASAEPAVRDPDHRRVRRVRAWLARAPSLSASSLSRRPCSTSLAWPACRLATARTTSRSWPPSIGRVR